MGIFFLWSEHPLQCCLTFGVYKSCESNLWILNLLQTPIISQIAHLLQQSKVDVFKQVIERTQNLIHKYGTTIYSDG